MPVALHSIIELCALAIIGLGLALKLRWMGWLTILKHKRTMLKVSINISNKINFCNLYLKTKKQSILQKYIIKIITICLYFWNNNIFVINFILVYNINNNDC